jgi:hypothetical protein
MRVGCLRQVSLPNTCCCAEVQLLRKGRGCQCRVPLGATSGRPALHCQSLSVATRIDSEVRR